MRIVLFLAAFLAMGAAKPVLSPEGMGSIRIGMLDTDAVAAAPNGAQVTESSDDITVCGEYLLGAARQMSFLTTNRKVARITVWAPGVETPEGVEVGDTAAEVRKAYGGKVQSEPPPYADPPAEDLYVWLAPDRGYRFEIDDRGLVVLIHAGDQSIRYMEGCL